MRDARCRCGSHRKYRRCCGRYHAGSIPPTPTDLMRARYTAYALGHLDFIVETTDPDGPAWNPDPQAWRESLVQFSSTTRFESLRVLEATAESPDEGFVTFRVSLRRDGLRGGFTERSRFLKVAGRWLYHAGEIEP